MPFRIVLENEDIGERLVWSGSEWLDTEDGAELFSQGYKAEQVMALLSDGDPKLSIEYRPPRRFERAGGWRKLKG